MFPEQIFQDNVPTCTSCNGLVKPDIVFFGECLPSAFYSKSTTDFPKADLLIVLGSSLVVQPFASLVDKYEWLFYHLKIVTIIFG